jgi:Peptidase M60, enhancin and enhancin-like/N-terminal domain of M60-like peptidases
MSLLRSPSIKIAMLSLAIFTTAVTLTAQERKADQASRADQAKQYARVLSSLLSGRALRRPGRVDEKAASAALAKLIAFATEAARTPEKPGRARNQRENKKARQARLDAVMSLADRGAALRRVVRAWSTHRGESPSFAERVESLCAKHRWPGTPGLDKEIDVLSVLGVVLDIRRTQTSPPGKVAAHASAVHFPGAVPASAPRVGRKIAIDTKIPRWHGTGLYAAPGESVEVEITALPAGTELDVIIGCHTDNIQRRPSWQRFPRISRRYKFRAAGVHQVASAFGGLIYLLSSKDDVGAIRTIVRGAVDAPRFVLGKTKVADWQERIRGLGAPFGELECEHLILTLPAKDLRTLDDPEPVLRFWTKVVSVQDELASYHRAAPERFVFDRQISAGYMHAGYPLMGPVSAAPNALDLETLRTKGNWGMFHEIGHNHQTVHFGTYANPWTFDRNIEVTVNIFSAYTYVAALERPKKMAHQHWRPDILEATLKASFTKSAYGARTHKERCLFWVHLIREFGWDGVRKVFGEYSRLPRASWPRGDLEKRSLLLGTYSKAVGHDLGALFQAWGLETTAAARESAAQLPRYEPKVAVPTNRN